jgi:hypothetical protein
VLVPLELVCAALGLDAAALADAVRRHLPRPRGFSSRH